MPVICVASPKGGVGKTTLAANLVREISRAGMRAVGLDLDPQNALRLELGVPLGDGRGFLSQIATGPNWRDCLITVSSRCQVLPFGAVTADRALEIARLIEARPDWLLGQIRDLAAEPNLCVVVDTEPGPSASLTAILPGVDILISVLLADAMSAAQLPVIDSGRAYGRAWPAAEGDEHLRHFFVINQYDPRSRLGATVVSAFAQQVGARLLGVIHRDEHVAEAAASQTALIDYAPGAQASADLRRIVAQLAARIGPAIRHGRNGQASSSMSSARG